MNDQELIEVLWSLSLSEHLGDVAEAIEPILKRFGIPLVSIAALNDELKSRNIMPTWAKE